LVADRDTAGRIAMKMRIVVPDATGANGLAERLSIAFGAEHISLRRDHREVDVRVERGSDKAILRVLDTVERWLDQTTVASVEMRLGERSHKLARWTPAETWQ
jgi:hypothetical protein